ncbi:uncharacterized protein LOC130936015 isoform X2 [Arachis stenosperma]|uniref:uncharacterized protein LOC130936015 isoform X2 n=1 Tax=Arachis stenosperma TaxID=217475 RepID=UPI0025ACB8B2|nr:uncharacterized protein LOC130936015 isoform X2 [Arachis stenosperma]
MDPANEVADRDVPISESAEHSTSTLPPLPTTSSERKNRSIVWEHFKRTPDDEICLVYGAHTREEKLAVWEELSFFIGNMSGSSLLHGCLQ